MSGPFDDLSDIEIRIERGQVLTASADVFIAKYAHGSGEGNIHGAGFSGAATEIANQLAVEDVDYRNLIPPPDGIRFVPTNGRLHYKAVLFIDVGHLGNFGYQRIRAFAQRALSEIRRQSPETRHVATTAHGPNYGLDEIEALSALLAGFFDAFRAGDAPPDLRVISIIELDPKRAARFQEAVKRLGGSQHSATGRQTYVFNAKEVIATASLTESVAHPSVASAGSSAEGKPRIFVAIPYAEEFDDTFFLGIQQPAHEEGFICERVDHDVFVGDVMQEVKRRIETSAIVIGELSSENPNVFLEIGYAWGKNRPTLLLLKDGLRPRFDVQGHKLICYRKIVDLREMIRKSLRGLRAQGVLSP